MQVGVGVLFLLLTIAWTGVLWWVAEAHRTPRPRRQADERSAPARRAAETASRGEAACSRRSRR